MINLILESNFIYIFIFLILIALSVLFSDYLQIKKHGLELEFYRKVPHIIIGIIFSLSPIFMSKIEIILASIILVLGILVAKYSPFFKMVFSINRITYGMWLTPLSLGVLAFIWLPENISVFLFGILILTFSDSLAALIGKFSKQKNFPFFKKTIAGSSAFFFSSILILFFLSPEVKILDFIWISFVLTLIEFIFIFGLDNLFLPIIASILFYFFIL